MNTGSEVHGTEKLVTTQEQAGSMNQTDVVPAHADAGHRKPPIESPGMGKTLGIMVGLALLVNVGRPV